MDGLNKMFYNVDFYCFIAMGER